MSNLTTKLKSKAAIINERIVEVVASDGEIFSLMCQVGKYDSAEYRNHQLQLIEYSFDKNFSEDKEVMTKGIWRDMILNGISFLGMSSGDRQSERIRIGKRIREIRDKKGIEARDLAKLANVDAANLSRIEQGKYSVGIDILSKLAFVLGYHIDIVQTEM